MLMQIRFANLRARIGSALMLGYVLEIGSPTSAQSTRNIDRFIGRWKEDESTNKNVHVRQREGKGDNPEELTVERSGSNGLKLLWPTGQIDEVTLTGKPAMPSGPNAVAGTMTATKLMPNGNIEEVLTRNGEPVTRRVYAVSPDGRTMTRTTTGLGKNATDNPSVYVYQKQLS
jgi:hypothetical protein